MVKSKFKLLIFIIAVEIVGLVGSYFTTPAIPTWYIFLAKPSFTPPNWLFGPVWTMLYAFAGISVYLVYQRGWEKTEVKRALYYFVIQMILNLLWSIIFFGMKLPLVAYIEINVLLGFIVYTAYKFYKISKMAGFLFIPYIIWVTFASFLNLAIIYLNR